MQDIIEDGLQSQAVSFNKALDLLVDKLITWFEQGVLLLPNIIIAILLVTIGMIVANFVAGFVEKPLIKYLKNKALASFLVTLSKITIVFCGILLAISVLHLDKAITSLLAGVGILGVTLGFAFQDITANFLSGIAMAINTKYPFAVGDIIQTKEITGNVEYINLRSTTIRTFQGQMVIVPNRQIYENPITNFSFLGMRRVDLEVGISYAENLEKVKELVLDTVKNLDDIVQSQPIDLYYEEFGDSSINFVVRFWVNFTKQTEYKEAKSNAIIEIKKIFDANGITIPFPIRTLDFGIKGGKTLSQMTIKN